MDVDFLKAHWDNDIDDLTLSQICKTLENERVSFLTETENQCILEWHPREEATFSQSTKIGPRELILITQ